MSKLKSMALALATAALVACGGGGDQAPALTPASATFPLQAAYRSYLSNPYVANYTLSGSCGGWASETTSPPMAGTFEGAPALVKTTTITLTRESCLAQGPNLTPVLATGSDTVSAQSFYDATLRPLGASIPNQYYTRFAAPVDVPATVRVGDTAILGTAPSWTSSSKTTTNGSVSASYVVETDTETSVIVKLVTRSFDNFSALQSTEIASYRLTAAGAFTLLRQEVFFPNGIYLVLTPR